MPRSIRNGLRLFLVLTCAAGAALAEQAPPEDAAEPAASAPLTIATRHAPPFAYQDADGRWSGVAIDLWERIADENGYTFEYIELGLQEMLDAVTNGRIDAAVAALSVTSAREALFDFSHPFVTAGLAIAVPQRSNNPVAALARFISPEFLIVVVALLALLVAVGVLIWLAERRVNAQFARRPLSGIGSGLWWSAVTMTTVGYGDKAPATLLGRAIGMVWMFAGLIVISTFTAAITTALTVNELDASIDGVQDLELKRVLALGGSTSDQFLTAEGIRHRTLNSLDQALEQLAAGQADAVVHDAPILRHKIADAFPRSLRVLPFTLTRQDYAIAMPDESELREPVNVALLRIISADDWHGLLERYLGSGR